MAGKPKAIPEAERAAQIAEEQEVAEENKNLKRNNFGVKIAENIDGGGHDSSNNNMKWKNNRINRNRATFEYPLK